MDISRSYLAAAFALTILAGGPCLWGCGDSIGTYESRLRAGWRLFVTGEYADASDMFRYAIEFDTAAADGFVGLGWAEARLGQFDSAYLHFSKAAVRQPDLPEVLACHSALSLARASYLSSYERAQRFLYFYPSWEFQYDQSIDSRDVRLILAQACFALGPDYDSVMLSQIDQLDPENGIDPADPTSWRGEASYSAAIVKELELIESLIGMDMF